MRSGGVLWFCVKIFPRVLLYLLTRDGVGSLAGSRPALWVFQVSHLQFKSIQSCIIFTLSKWLWLCLALCVTKMKNVLQSWKIDLLIDFPQFLFLITVGICEPGFHSAVSSWLDVENRFANQFSTIFMIVVSCYNGNFCVSYWFRFIVENRLANRFSTILMNVLACYSGNLWAKFSFSCKFLVCCGIVLSGKLFG
jgi:hypothetical protein